MILVILPLALQAQEIDIKTIKTEIFPFKLGTSSIIQTSHSYLHYVNLEPIIQQINELKVHRENINQQIHDNNAEYAHRLPHIEHLINEIDKRINELAPSKRIKRGLIDLVGNVQKWAFGTLDAEDGKKLNSMIKSLQENQNTLHSELKEQVSLSKNLISNYNQTIASLYANQLLLGQKIKIIQESVNVSPALSVVEDELILNCQNLITFLDNIKNAVTFAGSHITNDMILPRKDIQSIIEDLITKYGSNRIIKFQDDHSYYQLYKTGVTFHDNKIIFVIKIPIIKSAIYDYYQLFPSPRHSKVIIPQYPYLALNNEEYFYGDLVCPKIENSIICNEKDLKKTPDECIVPLLRTGSIKQCTPMQVTLSVPIIKQINPEYLLVLSSTPIKIKSCKKMYHIINETSIVRIPYGCQVEIENQKFINEEGILQEEPFYLPPISNLEMNENSTKINLRKINLEEINKIQQTISNFEIEPLRFPMDPSRVTSWILIITLIILIIGLAIYKSLPKRSRKPKTPQRSKKPSLEEIGELRPFVANLMEGGVI